MVKQERAGRTRQAVLMAAARTFADAGYESASLVDISRSAGVSKGALYFHFVSKQALAEGVRAAARRVIATAVLRARRSDGPAVQALLDLAHELARLLREDIVVRAGVLLSQGTQSGRPAPGAAAADRCGPWHDWTVMVRRQLAVAEAAGELRPGVGPEESAELLTAVAAGLVLLSWADAGVLRPEAVATVLASALPALVPAERRGDYRTDGSGVFPPAGVPAPAAEPEPEPEPDPGPACVFDLGSGFIPAPVFAPQPAAGLVPGLEPCSAASG
ncbi:ScbR family autoregulator-binding transcription factor [Kitasatospora sp. NBC_00240]|uniref:ScbR family autoregulator-binding transcription factor n=1 Tax=Kitasatospora sp. NBC_00240 TaxID=2903567 RepID=UPI002251B60D|nr:ScbR family autoregulator-binding transcription factor [Kitasatospora sp. NBC_00240]MCX5212261.1 ScbR family autoregulator-binding transcription factor [Kitasatospora sp. NBC_00240]